jgi:hypothetical protein
MAETPNRHRVRNARSKCMLSGQLLDFPQVLYSGPERPIGILGTLHALSIQAVNEVLTLPVAQIL